MAAPPRNPPSIERTALCLALFLLVAASAVAAGPLWALVRALPFFGAGMLALGGTVAGLALVQARALWRDGPGPNPLGAGARAFLLAAVPLGFLASRLDCMGLSLATCSPRCSFLANAWTPFIAVLVLWHGWRRSASSLLLVLVASASFLIPNCLCANPLNSWWIDRIGQSPMCYAASVALASTSSLCLLSRRHAAWSVGVIGAALAILVAFFVGHHYYGVPW